MEADEYVGTLTTSTGILVSIHSRQRPPSPGENAVFVAPGTSVMIGMQLVSHVVVSHVVVSHVTESRDCWSVMFSHTEKI